jgi:protein-tyrosine phosphatase
MIDLHAHVLPGIDDGARDLEEAAEMCRLAAEDGCEAIVATPHQRHFRWWNGDSADLADRLEELRAAVGDRPRLFTGAEIRLGPEIIDDLLTDPPHDATPLAGSRYLLLEARRNGHMVELEEILHEAQVAGWRPILAHPEMIGELADDLERLAKICETGVLTQVTAMSVTGEFGPRVRRSCEAMIERGLAHFVASDAHGVDWRPPGLAAACREIAARWGQEVARRLTQDNPLAVLENRALAGVER